MSIEKNSVSAAGQVQKRNYIEISDNGGKINVLFVGNSITRHEPNLSIGWANDWGMAATKRENDYVHVAVKLLENRFGKVNYCVTNCGEWELQYYNDEHIREWAAARDFRADIVIIRLGENIWSAREYFETRPLAPHFAKMVEFFRANPNAKTVVTGLFWRNEQIETAIEQVAREQGYIFVPLCDLGDNKENMAIGQFAHTGVAMHPNDEGMKQIAERIVNSL